MGNGVLVNCTNVSAAALVATRISPAISGASRFARQSACPERTVQPGSEKFAGGNGGAVRQPATLIPMTEMIKKIRNPLRRNFSLNVAADISSKKSNRAAV